MWQKISLQHKSSIRNIIFKPSKSFDLNFKIEIHQVHIFRNIIYNFVEEYLKRCITKCEIDKQFTTLLLVVNSTINSYIPGLPQYCIF